MRKAIHAHYIRAIFEPVGGGDGAIFAQNTIAGIVVSGAHRHGGAPQFEGVVRAVRGFRLCRAARRHVDRHRVGGVAVGYAVVDLEGERPKASPGLARGWDVSQRLSAEKGPVHRIPRAHVPVVVPQRARSGQRHDFHAPYPIPVRVAVIEVGDEEPVLGVLSRHHRVVGGRGRGVLPHVDRHRVGGRAVPPAVVHLEGETTQERVPLSRWRAGRI